jgi:hypothetical protein
MGLGIKTEYEERLPEFLRDDVYCSRMINEVIEYLPRRNFSEPVREIAKKLGKDITNDDVRETRQGIKKDRFVAYCLNLYGKTFMKKKCQQ